MSCELCNRDWAASEGEPYIDCDVLVIPYEATDEYGDLELRTVELEDVKFCPRCGEPLK